MKSLFKGHKGFLFFILFLSLALSSQIQTGKTNFADFQVYYGAASDLRGITMTHPSFEHKLPATTKVYDKAYGLGSGFYKYAPVTLLFFLPFTFIPWGFFLVVWPFVLSFFTCFLLYFVVRKTLGSFQANKTNPKMIFFLCCLIFLQIIWRELRLSNINVFLICGLVFTYFHQGKILKNLILALIITIKPHFLVILPLLLLSKFYPKDFYSKNYSLKHILILLGSLNLLPFFLFGFQKALELYEGWVYTMQSHNKSGGTFESVNTLWSWLKLINITSSLQIIVAILVLIIILFLMYSQFVMRTKKDYPLLLFLCLSSALIPNLINTDTNHFIYSFPLVVYIFSCQQMKKIHWAFLFPSFMIFSISLYEILGRDLSQKFYSFGALGLANIVLVLFVVLSTLKNPKWIISLK